MKKIFIMLLTMSALFLSLSAQDITIQDNCGIDNNTNTVLAYSMDVCQNDVSLKLLYSLMGGLYESNVFTFDYITNINSDELITKGNYYQRTNALIEDIFSVVYYISFTVIFLLLPYYAAVGVFNSAKDGKFLGNRWDFKGSVYRWGFASVFLIPFGSISVLQTIILHISMISIALANFAWGYYLNFMTGQQAVYEYTENLNIETDISSPFYNYAVSDIKNLTNIALCKDRSASYYNENKISTLTGFQLNNFEQCAIPNINTVNIQNFSADNGTNVSNDNSFINISMENMGNGSLYGTRISFSQDLSEQCNNANYYDYSCGNIQMPLYDMGRLVDSLSTGRNAESFQDYVIEQIFTVNSNNLDDSVQSAWQNVRNETINRFNLSDGGTLSKNSLELLEQMNFIFHSQAQNQAMYGYLKATENETVQEEGVRAWLRNLFSNDDDENPTLSVENSNLPIMEKLRRLEQVSDNIQNVACVGRTFELTSARNAANKILGSSASSDTLAECTRISDSGISVHGLVNGEILRNNDGNTLNVLDQYVNAQIVNSETIIEQMINEHYNIRQSIMNSYIKAHLNIAEQSSLKTLLEARQYGWAYAGSIILQIIAENETSQTLKNALLNTNNIYTENIGLDFVGDSSIDRIEAIGKEYVDMTQTYNQVFLNNQQNLNMTNASTTSVDRFVQDYLDVKQSTLSSINANDFLSQIVKIAFNIYDRFQTKMGTQSVREISQSGNQINVALDQCITGENNCGVGTIHPMIAISSFGKELQIFAGTAIITGTAYMTATRNSKKSKSDDGKTSEKAPSMLNKLIPLNSGKLLNMLNMSTLDLIISSIKHVLIMLFILGIFMGYIIPLIPFFAYFLIILSWVVLLFELMIVSMVWIGFLYQPKNQGENREAFQAFYNGFMQVLLRPLFSVISLIVAWSIFAISLMIVNLTIGPIMATITGGEVSFYQIIDIAFIIMTYTLVLYIVTQLVFKIMTEIPNRLFSILNVEEENVDSQSVTDKIKNTVEGIITFRLAKNISEEYQGLDEVQKRKQRKEQEEEEKEELKRKPYRDKVKSSSNENEND